MATLLVCTRGVWTEIDKRAYAEGTAIRLLKMRAVYGPRGKRTRKVTVWNTSIRKVDLRNCLEIERYAECMRTLEKLSKQTKRSAQRQRMRGKRVTRKPLTVTTF